MIQLVRQFIHSLINIIYPAQCLVCKQSVHRETVVCNECLEALENNLPPFCRKCGRNTNHAACFPHLHFDRAWSVCRYQGIGKELIHLFKYKGKTKLAGLLASKMNDFINLFSLPINSFDLITPIPLHPVKLREREFNQSEVIAKNISDNFGIKQSGNNLIRIRNNSAQAKLYAKPRFLNIKGAFSVKNEAAFKNKNILLIDDVLTTGATCSEAAKILKKAGAKNVSVFTFAG